MPKGYKGFQKGHKGFGTKESYERASKKNKGNTHGFKKGYKTPFPFEKGHIPWNKGKKHFACAGPKNHLWKGGKITDKNGYVWIRKVNYPFEKNGYIQEHRLIMERHIRRYLNPKEIVHHINEIKNDNRIENLRIFNRAQHLNHHRKSINLFRFKRAKINARPI